MATDMTAGSGRTGAGGVGTAGGMGTAGVGAGDIVQQTQVIAARDRVRWGPIVAGLLTALGTFLLLSTLASAIGLANFNVRDQNNAQDTARNIGIATAIIGLLSFLLGGYVAAQTAAVRGRGNGLLNGFLVWALSIPLVLLLAGMGLGAVLGAAGELFGQVRTPEAPDVDPQQAQDALRAGSLGAFISLALPAAAAAIGGLLGAREDSGRRETSGT